MVMGMALSANYTSGNVGCQRGSVRMMRRATEEGHRKHSEQWSHLRCPWRYVRRVAN